MYSQNTSSGSPLKWMLLGAAMGVLGFGVVFGWYESHRAKAEAIPPQVAETKSDEPATGVEATAPGAERSLVRVLLKDGQELLVDEVRNDNGDKETSLVIHIPKAEIAEVEALGQVLAEDDDEAGPEDQLAQAENAQAPAKETPEQPIQRSGNTGHIGRHFVASDWVNGIAARNRAREMRLRKFMLPMKRYLESYRNALRKAGLKVPKELDKLIEDHDPMKAKIPEPMKTKIPEKKT